MRAGNCPAPSNWAENQAVVRQSWTSLAGILERPLSEAKTRGGQTLPLLS